MIATQRRQEEVELGETALTADIFRRHPQAGRVQIDPENVPPEFVPALTEAFPPEPVPPKFPSPAPPQQILKLNDEALRHQQGLGTNLSDEQKLALDRSESVDVLRQLGLTDTRAEADGGVLSGAGAGAGLNVLAGMGDLFDSFFGELAFAIQDGVEIGQRALDVDRPEGQIISRVNQLTSEGMDRASAVQQAYRELSLPSRRINIVPGGGIGLPFGLGKLDELQFGLKGGFEAAVTAPGVAAGGVKKLASVPATAVKARAAGITKREARELAEQLAREARFQAEMGKELADTKVFEIPATDVMVKEAFKTTGHDKSLAVAKFPGMRRVLGFFKEAAVADDPIAHARVIRGQMEDMTEGAVLAATVKARALSTTGRAGFEKPVLDVVDGIVRNPEVRQFDNLPGIERSRASHDVVEFANRYVMSKEIRDLITEIRETSKKLSAYAKQEGVAVRQMKGEDDWVYLHRVVASVKQDAVNTVAKRASEELAQQASPIVRERLESSWAYLQRVVAGAQSGAIQQTPEIVTLLDDIAEAVDVKVVKQSLGKPRQHELASQGLEAGVRYLDNPVDELQAQASMIYRLVADKRVGEMLAQLSVKKDDLIPVAIKETRTQTASRAATALRLDKAVSDALGGKTKRVVSPSLMRALEREFPDIASLFRQALEIKPADLNQALKQLTKELKTTLQVTPAKFRVALGDVRRRTNDPLGIARPRGPVSLPQIDEALTALGADGEQVATLTSLIFQNAKSAPARTRQDILEGLKESTRALAKSTRDDATRAKKSLNLFRERAVTAEMGQVVGVPGVSGRAIPSQYINGKLVLGRDIAQEIRKQFGYLPRGATESIVSRVSAISNIYRLGKASFDVGIQGIQLMALLGMDFFNLATYPAALALREAGFDISPRTTNVFGKAASQSYWAFFNPKHELNYWLRPDKNTAMLERLRWGSLVQPSEFTVGQRSLQQVVNKVPGFGPRLKELVKQTYGRADAAWSTGRNVAANEYWIAYRDFAAQKGKLGDLGKMSNLVTGTLSLRGMGTPKFKRQFLNAFGFFSTRYTYSQAALIGSILKGGYTSEQALRAVTGIVMFNTAFFSLAALALGQDPKINPLPKSAGGDGADVWTIGIGNRRVGLGGAIYAPLRLIANVASDAIDEPERLISFDMSNPVIRAYRGKAPGPTSIAWDYMTGRDLLGVPIRGMGSIKPTAETLAWLAKLPTPIWGETLAEEGSILAAVTEIFGLRQFPESFWTQYRTLMEEASGVPFDQLSDLDKARFESTNDEVAEALKVAREDAANRGWDETGTLYWQTRDDARAKRDSGMQELQDAIDSNNLLHSEAYPLIRELNEALSVEYGQIDGEGRFAEVVAGNESVEKDFPEDDAYRRYWDAYFDPAFVDELGIVDYDARDKAIADLRFEVGEKVYAQVLERMGLERLKSPLLLQEYYKFIEDARPYFDVEKSLRPTRLEDRILWEKYLNASRPRRDLLAQENPRLAAMTSRVSGARRVVRQRTPELDVQLLQWGFVTVPQTPEGEEESERIRSIGL